MELLLFLLQLVLNVSGVVLQVFGLLVALATVVFYWYVIKSTIAYVRELRREKNK